MEQSVSGQVSDSEIKKYMALMKSQLQNISQGADISKHIDKIIEQYLQAPHRILKLICF